MGRVFLIHLEGKIYSCKHCRTHLALCDDVVSRVCSSSLSIHRVRSLFFVQVSTLNSKSLEIYARGTIKKLSETNLLHL